MSSLGKTQRHKHSFLFLSKARSVAHARLYKGTHPHAKESRKHATYGLGLKHTHEEMVQHGDEEGVVELKGRGELLRDLPHAVHKLHKHGRPLVVVVLPAAVPDALRKPMP